MDKARVPLRELFLTFMKIGCFTFGGGYAMIGLIHDICVEQKKWMTHDEMMNLTVIAESTPGPIAINCATYAGQKTGGIPGAVAATAGMVLPSFVIIFVISRFLDNLLVFPVVASAFRGIKVGVGILILRVGINMLKKMQKKPLPRIIAGCAFGAMLVINFCALRVSALTLMLLAGTVSLVIHLSSCREKGGAA